MEDIEEASMKVMAGPEKKSRVVTPEEKKLTAYHEAGHAVAGFYCKHHPRVHEITIIPRGQAGGYTMYLPEKDRSYVTKGEMFEDIVSSLGGRVAEQLILEDISTGASNDLQQATNIARQMITRTASPSGWARWSTAPLRKKRSWAATLHRARATVRPPLPRSTARSAISSTRPTRPPAAP